MAHEFLPEGECETCGKPYPDYETWDTMPYGDPTANSYCWAFPAAGDECDGNGNAKKYPEATR